MYLSALALNFLSAKTLTNVDTDLRQLTMLKNLPTELRSCFV